MMSSKFLLLLTIVGIVAIGVNSKPHKKRGDTVCLGFEVPRRDSSEEEEELPQQDAAFSNPFESVANRLGEIPSNMADVGREMFGQYSPQQSAQRSSRSHNSLPSAEKYQQQSSTSPALSPVEKQQQQSSTSPAPLSSQPSKRSQSIAASKAPKLF